MKPHLSGIQGVELWRSGFLNNKHSAFHCQGGSVVPACQHPSLWPSLHHEVRPRLGCHSWYPSPWPQRKHMTQSGSISIIIPLDRVGHLEVATWPTKGPVGLLNLCTGIRKKMVSFLLYPKCHSHAGFEQKQQSPKKSYSTPWVLLGPQPALSLDYYLHEPKFSRYVFTT